MQQIDDEMVAQRAEGVARADFGQVEDAHERRPGQLLVVYGNRLARLDVLLIVVLVLVLAAGDVAGEEVQQRLCVAAGATPGEHASGPRCLQRQALRRTFDQLASTEAGEVPDVAVTSSRIPHKLP